MPTRIAISLLLIAASWVAGRYLPADLIRHPPGTDLLSIPNDADVISCYTATGAADTDRVPFSGKSDFGEFWRRRRSLHLYDGHDLGPRNEELESTWQVENASRAGFLVYRTGTKTNAIVYCREAGWTSGAILGQMAQYALNESGRWVKVREDYQGSDSLAEWIFRCKTVSASVLLGTIVVVAWNIMAAGKRRHLDRGSQDSAIGG